MKTKNLEKQFFTLTLFSMIFITSSYAQTDFTGIWGINKEKSDFGKLPPNSATVWQKITQNRESLNVERHQVYATSDSTIYTEKLNFEGKPSEAIIKGDQKKTSFIKWSENKKALNIESTYSNGIKAKESWSLSPDGKLLTVDREAVIKDVLYKVKYVYAKQ